MSTSAIRAILDALRRANNQDPSGPSIIDHLMDMLYFGDFFIREEISSGAGPDHINLIGRKGHARGAPLVFVSDLPVIPEGSTTLIQPSLSSDQTRILSPWSQSGYMDALLKILAASTFSSESLKRPVYVLLLSGGETYSSYLRPMLTRMIQQEGSSSPGLALTYAPTALGFYKSHPGSLVMRLKLVRRTRHRRMPPHAGFFEIRVHGRASHCLSPNLGSKDHALSEAQRILELLREYGEVRLLSIEGGSSAHRVAHEAILKVATNFVRLPDFGPHVEIAPISDGTILPFPIEDLYQAWQLAYETTLKVGRAFQDIPNTLAAPNWLSALHSERDELSGLFTLWLGPKASARDLHEHLQRALQQKLHNREEIEFELEVLQHRPAWKGRIYEQERVETLRLAAQRTRMPWRLIEGVHPSEAAWLSDAGFDCAVFSPCGDLDAIYVQDEHLSLETLKQGLEFYRELIQVYCVEER